jgi:hypothetical protein
VCTCGNALSLLVLIGRAAWPQNNLHDRRTQATSHISCPSSENTLFGGYGEEATPVPIPNTEVKLFSADGTARGPVWESRSPPKFILKSPDRKRSGLFLFSKRIALQPVAGRFFYWHYNCLKYFYKIFLYQSNCTSFLRARRCERPQNALNDINIIDFRYIKSC